MKDQIKSLWELQCLEQRQKTAAQSRENVNSDEVRIIWQEIQHLAKQIAADKQKLEALKLTCAAREEQVNSLVAQLKTFEKQLYSGELTHVKELEQLKTKCEEIKQDIERQEAALFETMEVCEGLSESIKATEQQAEERKRSHSRKQQELAVRTKQADQEADAAEQACQAVAAGIDPAILLSYHRLKSKIANPVAKLENGVCSGCRMSTPTRQASAVQDTVVYCDNCGRILLQ